MSTLNQQQTSSTAHSELAHRFSDVRALTEQLVGPLSAEDCAIQSMEDVSPTRWHLAHTTWFFETFILSQQEDHQPFDDRYEYLFNSYYNAVGAQFPRPQRGLLSRPTLSEVMEYRQSVDMRMLQLLDSGAGPSEQIARIVELGLHHEQQHQELMLTDIKHVFSCNPLYPTYRADDLPACDAAQAEHWEELDAGVYWIGHDGDGFAFDNESPRHRVFLEEFAVSDRLVTCGEYLEFIEDGGYRRPELWLSAGWHAVGQHGWQAPLYWVTGAEAPREFTLAGLKDFAPDRPVCHVSYFEADAFARWSGARLPTEAEWEVAAAGLSLRGNFADGLLSRGRAIHPATPHAEQPTQMMGDVWEWTSSAYNAYPGYDPPDGALGEYNGKFMCNQFVLRGGSCATPASHARLTYRNFFPPDARWQFTGIRLAK